jgi:hypothetical protein
MEILASLESLTSREMAWSRAIDRRTRQSWELVLASRDLLAQTDHLLAGDVVLSVQATRAMLATHIRSGAARGYRTASGAFPR